MGYPWQLTKLVNPQCSLRLEITFDQITKIDSKSCCLIKIYILKSWTSAAQHV